MELGSASESQIQALRKDGFRVALDDFGTGYSSLSYLRRFQVDRLKLDKSFAVACEMQDSITIMRAAVGLAHLLGLEVVAEGIETSDQESIALESGCDVLQGHHYAYPMTDQRFREYRRANARDAA
jgi:EAL domain-containing protein (putative c-di-GMP-specific phosphodiesterase class I)